MVFVKTFIAGGIIGVIGQLLLMMYAALGLGELLAVMATLLTFGIIGSLTYAFGLYDRFEKIGGAASFLTFPGLGAAMSKVQTESRQGGASFLRAAGNTWKAFFGAVGIGIFISLVIGAMVTIALSI